MDVAFDRLTDVLKDNINKQMFEIAFDCVKESNGDFELLKRIVNEKTKKHPDLKNDLMRYCRLADRVKP